MPFWPVDELVVLVRMEERARVCAFLGCWSRSWVLLARRKGRVCIPFWPVDAAGGPCWDGGKDACVYLFGLLMLLVVLFGTEVRTRVCMSF